MILTCVAARAIRPLGLAQNNPLSMALGSAPHQADLPPRIPQRWLKAA